jgi:hypothetical protein
MQRQSKHRLCPALGTDITPKECGERRNASIACTADCPFNPFTVANRDRLHALERRVNATSIPVGLDLTDRIARIHLHWAVDQEANPGGHAAFLLQQALHVERDEEDKTRATRWIDAGLPGLETNDEKVLFRSIAQMRMAVMETRRVMDHDCVEVVDLLRPEQGSFILMDPEHWRSAVRYGVSLARVYELPLFHRCAGMAFPLLSFHGLEPVWVAREVARHLGWEPSGMTLGDWLMANQMDFLRSWIETLRACDFDAAQLHPLRHCWAVYALHDSADECVAAIEARRWVRHGEIPAGASSGPATSFFDWFDPCPGNPTRARLLARIYVAEHRWVIHAAAESILAEARRQFERTLGDRVELAAEKIEEIKGLPRSPATPDAAALVVPSVRNSAGDGLRPPGYVFAFDREGRWVDGDDSRAMMRRMAEDPNPLLDGKSPQEAARDPALRARLNLLLKSTIRGLDSNHLATGAVCDSDWLLRDLGFEDLILPAPPVRPPPKAFNRDAPN